MPLVAKSSDILIPPTTEDDHTMGSFLKTYVSQRLHQDISQGQWETIHVIPTSLRPPEAVLSTWETGEPRASFNFQRPTTRVLDESTIQLHCFPSPSYVQHYAAVVKAYFAWQGDQKKQPHISLEPCSKELLQRVLEQSNLLECPTSDIVILGEAHQLHGLYAGGWLKVLQTVGSNQANASEASRDEGLFSWTALETPNGKKVTLLSCKEALWGETPGEILRTLAQRSKLSSLVYVGKAGALSPGYNPNHVIVTGNKAFVATAHPSSSIAEGVRAVSWRSCLAEAVESVEAAIPVVDGSIVSVASPLVETKQWLAEWRDTSDWVDCETAHIAFAAVEYGVHFGYLHVLSDNLVDENKDNLSNELLRAVYEDRKELYKLIETIITRFLDLYR